MNVSWEVIKLLEKKRKLEKARDELWETCKYIWQGGFVFAGGLTFCMLTIEGTPHWVSNIIIGSVIFTLLLSLFTYKMYQKIKIELKVANKKLKEKTTDGKKC